VSAESLPTRLWFSDAVSARAARALLAPVEAAFGAGVMARNWLYDKGVLPSRSAAAPVISVGNLTVGGTGKTPITAHLVQRLAARDLRPAILMRGSGRDEIAVHEVLNPGVPVLAAADRVAARPRSDRSARRA
jgi:tetraacyldisaccharide 4'-kinase